MLSCWESLHVVSSRDGMGTCQNWADDGLIWLGGAGEWFDGVAKLRVLQIEEMQRVRVAGERERGREKQEGEGEIEREEIESVTTLGRGLVGDHGNWGLARVVSPCGRTIKGTAMITRGHC